METSQEKPAKPGKVFITILSGFLGSGKTSLLNHIIRTNTDRRIAIIENEFGEIAIDNELVISEKEDIYTLANGCVCCSLNTELLDTILKLRDKGIEQVIIETTGIADPGQVAGAFLFGPEMRELHETIVLNAIVTLVDARQIEKQLKATREVQRQIGYADVLVLNKVDLVDAEQKQRVKRLLQSLNTEARLYEAEFGKVEIPNLFALNLASAQSVLKGSFTDGATDENLHEGLVSYSFVIKEPLDINKLSPWLMALIFLSGTEIYRSKGILQLRNERRKYIFQSVGEQFLHEYGTEWQSDEEQVSKLVFIGRNLNREMLATGLYACVETTQKTMAAGTFLRR
ncbi:MAG: GTP-binding protein [Cytophagales bacterium]|nr:GTP-binding protein [Cytophagales bacterium]